MDKPRPGTQLDLVNRLVAGALPLLVHMPVMIDEAVRRTVELGRVGFEGMGAELFDIDGDRRGKALRAQHVEPRRRAVGVRQQEQIVLRPCIIGRNQGRGILNGGIGSCQMGDAVFACHVCDLQNCL